MAKEGSAGSNRPTIAPTPLPGILIADDEPAIRKLLEMGLRHHGFHVWVASDGREALQVYQEHRDAIALVLLDVQMPELDGPHSLAAFQKLNPEVRCCFMSGNTGEYTEAELLGMGAACVIRKPFALAEASSILHQLADSPTDSRPGPSPSEK